MNLKVVIPAAGKGSRLSVSPDAPPKAMFQLCGRPLIDIVLKQTSFVVPDDTCIIVGYKKDAIIEHCGPRYHYAEQREQLGTGHAVMQCAEFLKDFDGTVLVTFGDMPLFRGSVMKAMCEYHESKHAACTLMTAVKPELELWARIVRDKNNRFASIVEGKDCTPQQAQIQELFAGVLVFDCQKLFEYLPKLKSNNVQHEYYLTEIPELMATDGLLVETYPTDDPDDLRGINCLEDVSVCEEVLSRRSYGFLK